MVDEDAAGVGLGDVGRELAEGLAHQACLQTDLVVTHLAFNLGFRRKGGHRVNHDNVDGAAADEVVGDFEGLLAVVRLRDEQRIDVDTQIDRVGAVKGMLGIDNGGDALFLGFRDGVDGQCGLAAGFGSVDLDDPATRIAANAEGVVQRDGTCRDR